MATPSTPDIVNPSILGEGGKLAGLGKGLGHAGTALDVTGAGMGVQRL
ncbi:MAG: hypothetical protein ACKV2T_36770 [Kofleriaceae bacterium]